MLTPEQLKSITSGTRLSQPKEDQSLAVRLLERRAGVIYKALPPSLKVAEPDVAYPPEVGKRLELAKRAIAARYHHMGDDYVRYTLRSPWVMVPMPREIRGVSAVVFFGSSIRAPKNDRFSDDFINYPLRRDIPFSVEIGLGLGSTFFRAAVNDRTRISENGSSYQADVYYGWQLPSRTLCGDHQTEVLFAKDVPRPTRGDLTVKDGILMFPSRDVDFRTEKNGEDLITLPSPFLFVTGVSPVYPTQINIPRLNLGCVDITS